MADFPAALDAALNDFYSVRGYYASPVESNRGFKARKESLERAYGSKAAAARAAGIKPGTWYGWKDRVPGAESRRKIAAAHTALLRAGKVARKGYPRAFGIVATVAARPKAGLGREPKASTYYNGGSSTSSHAYRQFNTFKLHAEDYRAVVNTWAAGGSPQDTADALLREIERRYPGSFAFEGNQVNVKITE